MKPRSLPAVCTDTVEELGEDFWKPLSMVKHGVRPFEKADVHLLWAVEVRVLDWQSLAHDRKGSFV